MEIFAVVMLLGAWAIYRIERKTREVRIRDLDRKYEMSQGSIRRWQQRTYAAESKLDTVKRWLESSVKQI